MADEKNAEEPAASSTPGGLVEGTPPGDVQPTQRTLANRLFPGPSRRMSPQAAENIRGLLRPLDRQRRDKAHGGRGYESFGVTLPPEGTSMLNGGGAATQASSFATPEDIAKVHAALDDQTELLRAILATTSDTQTDARSTAQNSRTFAWASTIIALLTLIATVLSIVAAVQAH